MKLRQFYYKKKLHCSQTSRPRYYAVTSFTTKRNYTVLKPQIHGAENTLFLQNRVISVDISGKTAQIPIYHKGFFTFEKFGNTVFN